MGEKSNNLVGVTGEYYVYAELGKLGILAETRSQDKIAFINKSIK